MIGHFYNLVKTKKRINNGSSLLRTDRGVLACIQLKWMFLVDQMSSYSIFEIVYFKEDHSDPMIW